MAILQQVVDDKQVGRPAERTPLLVPVRDTDALSWAHVDQAKP